MSAYAFFSPDRSLWKFYRRSRFLNADLTRFTPPRVRWACLLREKIMAFAFFALALVCSLGAVNGESPFFPLSGPRCHPACMKDA